MCRRQAGGSQMRSSARQDHITVPIFMSLVPLCAILRQENAGFCTDNDHTGKRGKMSEQDKPTPDISSLFDAYIYRNLIRSLLARKQGTVIFLPEHNGAVLLWGPSVFIGGTFSPSNGESVVSLLADSGSPRYLNLPDERWESFIKRTFSDKLKDRYLHLYQSDFTNITALNVDIDRIVPITRDFMEKHLPDTELIVDELYSYTNMEDFYQNGFGVALVIDGVVSGYCLSEYSIDNSLGVNIWINEKFRGAGYARNMVNVFLAHCREQGLTAYWVCNADNIRSNKVAVSAGFVLKSAMRFWEV